MLLRPTSLEPGSSPSKSRHRDLEIRFRNFGRDVEDLGSQRVDFHRPESPLNVGELISMSVKQEHDLLRLTDPL